MLYTRIGEMIDQGQLSGTRGARRNANSAAPGDF